MDVKSPLLGSRLRVVAIGVLAAVAIVTPALADCYDLVR